MFNSYINKLLIIDLIINFIKDNIFVINYIINDLYFNKLKIKEFKK